jgi:colanic acid/amylovoran biosynthesis glycosyltransferase
MTTVAYIANEFPCAAEPYVKDEIAELRGRGVRVIPCSGRRVSAHGLNYEERALWNETLFFQPLADHELLRATRRIVSDRSKLWHCLKPILLECGASPTKRLRALGHTVMGAALAEQLAPLGVRHIHAHHGYFASWMALVAARLLGIGFSLTLHGSDLLLRADLLAAKLRYCKFCVTVSDFNRNYLLQRYSSTSPAKVIVQRLGVDRVFPSLDRATATQRRFCLLAVGRLHRVKNHEFLIQACGVLRNQGLDFICWIVGDGPERSALQRQIHLAHLQDRVYLIGQTPRDSLDFYYRHADLVVMTSLSEGIPVVLMEAMAHGKLVLAPAITGIPELVEDQRTGFLYDPGSLPDFVQAVRWILSNRAFLSEVPRAASAYVACYYNRQKNVRSYADQFLARVQRSDDHAHPLLQQVRLSV